MDKIIQNDIERLVKEFHALFSGKKILVTGGAGFLGSWLCDVSVNCGGRVTCLDNLSTGSTKNIEHLKGAMRIIAQDVEDLTLDEDYDYIFNFSSRASPEEYVRHPVETLTANSVGVMKLLEHAKKGNTIIVQASTSEVYGDPKIVPTPESYYGYTNPVGVRSCYDEGKRFAEALCVAYQRQHSVDVRIARIFNTYGPRIQAQGLYGRSLPKFIFQALRNEPMTIYGDGKQTRSFCYVTDTISGMLRLAGTAAHSGLVVNIGNSDEMAIIDLAEKIRLQTNSESKFSFSSLMEDDPKRRCPDITKAAHILSWKPVVDLDEGLDKTIDWFKTELVA